MSPLILCWKFQIETKWSADISNQSMKMAQWLNKLQSQIQKISVIPILCQNKGSDHQEIQFPLVRGKTCEKFFFKGHRK